MSPFVLMDGREMPCLGGGKMYPLDHAWTCTCPCPACIDLHRQVLEHVGLLDADRPASHVFVYALGSLAVAQLASDEIERDVFYGLYFEICNEREESERIPVAAFGWLIPTDDDSTFGVVTAPSNPHRRTADEALSGWAVENGHRLERVIAGRGLRRKG